MARGEETRIHDAGGHALSNTHTIRGCTQLSDLGTFWNFDVRQNNAEENTA